MPRLPHAFGLAARSRFVQFAVIGGVLFGAAPRPADDRRIDVTGDELAAVTAAEAARHGARGLSSADVAAVRQRLLEDKLLYREGVRLGLAEDDPIIRQRVIQKVLLLAEDLGAVNRPATAAELRAAYDAHPERYRQPPELHLVHVFATRREDLPPASVFVAGAAGPPAAGEPFPLPRETRATAAELRAAYGAAFGDAVAALAAAGPGAPSEPVRSTFGWHRVQILEVTPGRARPLAEVERELGFELLVARRTDAMRRFVGELAARYDLALDGARVTDFAPSVRLARQEEPSGED